MLSFISRSALSPTLSLSVSLLSCFDIGLIFKPSHALSDFQINKSRKELFSFQRLHLYEKLLDQMALDQMPFQQKLVDHMARQNDSGKNSGQMPFEQISLDKCQ
jgi:hypothetical protein